MREFRSSGSVRGALGNGRPYRERRAIQAENVGLLRDGGMAGTEPLLSGAPLPYGYFQFACDRS